MAKQLACVQTSPISFIAHGKGFFSACNKGNRRRLHAGNATTRESSDEKYPRTLILSPDPELSTPTESLDTCI